MSAQAAAAVTRVQAGIDVLLAILLVPFGALVAGVVIAIVSPQATAAAGVLVQAAVSLAGLHWLLRRRAQGFRAIGLERIRLQDLGRGLLVLLAGFAANALLMSAVYAVSPQLVLDHVQGLRRVALALTEGVPITLALGLLLVVGFYEELVARGLLLWRSRRLLGGHWAPVLFSAALFGLGHFYQGWLGAVQTAVLGAVLAAFTIRWGTLWPAILAHAAINMLSVAQLDRVAPVAG